MKKNRWAFLVALRSLTCLTPALVCGMLPAVATAQAVTPQPNLGKAGSGSSPGSPPAAITLTNPKTTSVNSTFNSAVSLATIGGQGSSSGSRGGRGSAVTLTQTGNAGATLRAARGSANTGLIVVQSQGGAGGNSNSFAGAGGDGAAVTVNLLANATAVGSGFSGILAQSLGGNAGQGGTPQPFASTGGNAGSVTVSIGPSQTLSTSGANSNGVFAQSLGGAGVVGLVGGGGTVSNGGNAGTVSFTNQGAITTNGDSSSGVYLLSQGGQGGVQQIAKFGGNGGNGGNGGQVTANQAGSISTSGSYSFGLVAQSLGGSGGKGGDADFSAGDGGNAGSGGAVTVTNTGTITTTGTGATAIVANSMGGGSPAASFQSQAQAAGVTSAVGGGAGGKVFLSFFGSAGRGGSGADGGSVTVYNSGNIKTSGTNADGILAQSVGGGGGNGGKATTVGLFLSIANAGNGGGGGNGGAVTVLPSAGWALPDSLSNITSTAGGPTITTSGDSGTAIFAQSVGGGGGTGGAAWSGSLGVGFSGSVSVGGSGGLGGSGGTVNVGNLATLTTSGNSASGVFAQSVGGGGGVAGSATSTAIAIGAAEIPAIGLTVGVGGTGGSGGSGGAVTVSNIGAITTSGQQSAAILAQSVGGGGGSGGAASASTKLNDPNLNIGSAVAIGGKGGGGGSGGMVSVTNEGQISTQGAFSNGITAQSVGGGGGDGGTANAATSTGFGIPTTIGEFKDLLGLSTPEALDGVVTLVDEGLKAANPSIEAGPSVSFNFALGGSGGGGGGGSAVQVTNSGTILTANTNSNAILAQSVGGGGGSASGISGSTGGAKAGGGGTTLDLSLALGGSGGDGGSGGAVTVTNSSSGKIQTMTAGSSGIVAQSIGGGGGLAGAMGVTSSANQLNIGLPTAHQFGTLSDDLIEAGVKYGELVGSANTALKAKQGELRGFLDKTFDTPFFSTNAASVDAANKANSARRKASSGVLGQFANNNEIETNVAGQKVTIPINLGLNIALGGSGGNGGNGGTVTVTNDGGILTLGDQAHGILAQSIGGGGGVGGSAYLNQANQFNIGGSVGGTGGLGGLGGTVTVANTGDISTAGDLSEGILAQSIGGGGGIGGVSSGGAAGLSLSAALQLGGKGGSAQNAGSVTVANSSTISTLGDQSQGILAQSIGGGGGLITVEGTPAIAANGSTGMGGDALGTTQLASITPSLQVPIAIGGGGGGGGNGGSVTVTNSGIVGTAGKASFGIFAQSIGGGGGTEVNSNLVSNLRVGSRLGAAGAGGNGGPVTVNLSPQPGFLNPSQSGILTLAQSGILTLGDGAVGLVAQSIGGGGGYSGTSSWLTPTVNSTGSSGNGGAITVNASAATGQTSVILTEGRQAHGMYLQSLGGGGGLITNADGPIVVPENNSPSRGGNSGAGGAITVNGDSNSLIATFGRDASAIIAQSGMQKADGSLDPTRTGGDITISWDGLLQGGEGTGVGVLIDGGANNTLNIGADGELSALSGNAIQATFGNDTVNDAGLIDGNVNLDGGKAGERNAFNILTGGTFVTGTSVGLGASGTLTNSGLLDIAGAGVIGATKLTGNFVNSGGTMAVDANFGTMQADVLNVSGIAQLKSGQVTVNLLGLPVTFDPDNMPTVPVVTASSVLLGGGMKVTPTVVLSYNLVNTNGTSAGLKIAQADFMPASVAQLPGVTEDMKSVASDYQSAWDTGNLTDAGWADYLSYLANLTDPNAYARELSNTDNEQESVSGDQMLFSGLEFQNTLHSCPVFVEDTTVLNEQDCVYLRNIGSASNMPGDAGGPGYHSSGYAVELGGEKQFAPGWFIGGAIAPGQSWSSDTAKTSEASTNTLDVGLVVKHFVTSRLLLAGSVSYGNDSTILSHSITDPDLGTLTSQAQQELNRVTGRIRAEYDIPIQSWYIRPMMDADLTYQHMTPYTESGEGLFDTSYKAVDKVVPDFSPTVEFGKRLNYKNLVARLYTDIGMTWFISPTWQQEGHFVDLPEANFETSSYAPPLVGRLTVGAQLMAWKNLSFEAEYDGTYSPAYVDNTGTLRVDWRF